MQKISVIYDKKKIFKEQCAAFKIKKYICLYNTYMHHPYNQVFLSHILLISSLFPCQGYYK